MERDQIKKILLLLQETGLLLLALSLPLANLFMSISTFWLLGVWILWMVYDGGVKKRMTAFLHQPAAWSMMAIFLLFTISLLWSNDMKTGSKEVLVKLPILVIPWVISGFEAVSKKQFHRILKFYLLGLVIACAICLSVYFGFYNTFATPLGFKARQPIDVRDISILISHIRFSLMLVLGIGVAWYLIGKKELSIFIAIPVVAIFLGFMWAVESMTGFVLIFVLALFFLLRRALFTQRKWLKWTTALCLIVVPLVSFLWVKKWYNEYFTIEQIDFNHLDEYSAKGNMYYHIRENREIENGHYTWIYIVDSELKEEWAKRSQLPFDSSEKAIRPALIRYMTSKGLRKDANGVQQLSDEDIRNIEKGIPNVTWTTRSGIRLRMDRLFYEWDIYTKGGDPNGHSVRQRILFWETAYHLIERHFWTGVGVGDVRQEFQKMYDEMKSPLDKKHRLGAHNQYLTTWVSVGIVGLFLFLVFFYMPFFQAENRRNWLLLCAWLIVAISFITEDTIESQAGVCFYAFSISLFSILRVNSSDSLRSIRD